MSDVFGPASLAAGQALSGFMSFLPRLSDVRKANAAEDTSIVGDVRLGQVAGTAIALGIGAIASSLSRSAIPMYSAAFIAIIMIVVYEMALRGENLFEPSKTETVAVGRNA